MLVSKLFSWLSSHWLAIPNFQHQNTGLASCSVWLIRPPLSGNKSIPRCGVRQLSHLTLSYRGGGEEGQGDHDGGAITAPAPRGRQATSERRFSRLCRRRSLTLITGHTNKRVSERARGGMERMLWHLGNRPFTLRGRQTPSS